MRASTLPSPASALWRCCALGDWPGAAAALARGASPDAELAPADLPWARAALGGAFGAADLDGLRPLALSARMGSRRCFQALAEAGADPAARSASGLGPMRAAMMGRKAPAALAAMDLFERLGMEPEPGSLLEAVEWGSPGIVQRLLARGADPAGEPAGKAPMIAAAERRRPWLMAMLGAAGAGMGSRRASDGAQALSIAASLSDLPCMEAALALGADLEDLDAEGRSALHRCVLKADPAAAIWLARHGAQLEHPWPAGGFTPLGRAARGGKAEAMEALLACGANPHRVGDKGEFSEGKKWNAILACLTWREERDFAPSEPLKCLRMAIAAGVDLEYADSIGRWALRLAFYGRDVTPMAKEKTQMLFAAGADPDHRDADGLTLLEDCALRCLNPGYGVPHEHIKMLLDHGATVTELIMRALDRQPEWQANCEKWGGLGWIDLLKAAFQRQEEARQLAAIPVPAKRADRRSNSI